MKRKTNNTKENGKTKWTVILLIFGILTCAPAGVVLALRVGESMTDNDARLLLGIVVTAVLFLLCAAMLSMFIMAYSHLRRKEEDEDDQREMDLMRIMLGQRPETKYNYNIKPGQPVPYQIPYGQTYPQQPVAEAPPAIQYVEEDVNLGG